MSENKKSEFEKRMRKYHDNDKLLLNAVKKAPTIPLNQYHHGYVKGFNSCECLFLQLINEARKELPQSKKWKTPIEELKYWRQVLLSGQSREVASWIKGRIETLEWVIEWFGDEKK